MGRTRKGVSLAKQETLINIESPLNNTYIEPKVEEEKPHEEVKEVQEETKPKRERKKKKKAKQIERPALITYTISGCVKNSKGRFKFTDIVNAQDENIAVDIFKQRAKKEFSAVRAINKIEVNQFKEGDIKNIEEIIEDLKISDPIKDIPLTDEELSRLILNTILTINEQKIYKVIYAPSNKKSVIRKVPRLYYMAKNLEEMKLYLEQEAKENVGEYNEKYIQSVQVLEDSFSPEVIETIFFKKILRQIKKLTNEQKEKLKKFYNDMDELTPETITDEKKKEMIDFLLEIPKMVFESDGDDSFIAAIKGLEIKNCKKSVELESTANGLLIKDTGHTESVLGSKYALYVDKDKDTKKLKLIKPVIPVVMNQNIFKTYTVHSERNNQELIDHCEVIAESEDKASDYIIFVGKEEKLIKRGDTIKTDVYLENKLVASFICGV